MYPEILSNFIVGKIGRLDRAAGVTISIVTNYPFVFENYEKRGLAGERFIISGVTWEYGKEDVIPDNDETILFLAMVRL